MTTLTIGIPTFNNCTYLKQAIDNILVQIESASNVELLICDNASDDETERMVESYTQKYPNAIRYIRHKSNLGMDRNFWSVIQNAQGDFVHLHGSDDFYTKDGVKRIIEKIASHEFDVILLSNNYLNTHNNKTIQNKETYETDILVDRRGEDFFLHENLKTLCLSNVIVKRSKCLEVANIEKYFGCQWFHIALLVQIMTPTSSAYIFNFSNPVITVRIGNQKWLEKDGAIDYYYKALLLFSSLKDVGYDKRVFEHIKLIFLPLILNGGKINSHKPHVNLVYCFRFLKFYYNMPKQYILFCLKLLLKKHRPFFEGWEKVGD